MEINDWNKYIQKVQQVFCGKKDLIENEYWGHPIRVASKLPIGCSDDAIVAALFHDVLEDTDYTLNEIDNEVKITKNSMIMINLLTKKQQMPYKQYIKIIAETDYALVSVGVETIIIKLCDLADNLDITRMLKIEDKTKKRLLNKYLPAVDILFESLDYRTELYNKYCADFDLQYPTFTIFKSQLIELCNVYKYHQI